jgi:hypothetical protein
MRTTASCDKRRDWWGRTRWGWQICCREFFFLILSQVEDVFHHLVHLNELVRVEGVDDTLFRLSELAGA